MSELKAYKMVDEKYCTDCVCVIPSEVYLKSEADKVIADLEESHKKEVWQLLMEIAELKADYKEACDRLQTANIIKDEQLAETRHSKYKRCLAMAKACHEKSERMYCEASTAKSLNEIIGNEPKDAVVEKFELLGAIASTHRKRWLELAEKFKEAK